MSEHRHHHSSSLEDQIREREAHVLLRQEAVAARAGHVVLQFKHKVASPVVLLAAFSGGFIVDRIMRLIPRRGRSSDSQARSSSQRKPGIFARLMEVAVVIRSLLTAWPTSLIQGLLSMSSSSSQPHFRSAANSEPASAPVYPVDADFYP